MQINATGIASFPNKDLEYAYLCCSAPFSVEDLALALDASVVSSTVELAARSLLRINNYASTTKAQKSIKLKFLPHRHSLEEAVIPPSQRCILGGKSLKLNCPAAQDPLEEPVSLRHTGITSV